MEPAATAIIVAGGIGRRMGSGTKKQYLALAGKPILTHTLLNIAACPLIHRLILVVPEADIQFCRERIVTNVNKPLTIVPGGMERQDSVYQGLQAVQSSENVTLIHDGVRPFIQPDLIAACIHVAAETGACILAIPVTDTLKQIDASNQIVATIDRAALYQAQTPQCFRYPIILEAHQFALQHRWAGTDDASLVEKMGKKVSIIPGSQLNIKITTPAELALAQAIQSMPQFE